MTNRKRAKKSRSKKVGLPPGTLIHIGDQKTEQVKISVCHYQNEFCEERILESVNECRTYLDRARNSSAERPAITWINVEGLHDISVIEKLGDIFELHPLVLEDIVNTTQRAKRMDYEDYIFVCMRMLNHVDDQGHVDIEQLSLILGDRYVLTFQERPGDCLNPLRARIRHGKGRIRKLGPDYLFYAIMDSIVDNYFSVLEDLGERIEAIEQNLLDLSSTDSLQGIHHFRREMLFVRRAVWPLREVVSSLAREELPLICDSTRLFIRDVYDHTIEVIDIVETTRDIIAGLADLYMSNVSNRVNEVMKTLTVLSTIFMPLTFIVGVYGMNFESMPELHWTYGYQTVMGVMGLMAAGMLWFFRRKGWV